ncbi:thioredoxin family protein [Exiguobacterium sp. KRL4]|uniref:glutaredoxin family protein n=1 Tax=Exiguobacterium sp. KRL4 TaxID=1914536 RepID=UPI0008F962E8|nr:glutaredoxin family protein [Exiguobacterium sp. KRL4]OIN68140.1 thioredoxin family protein [Exiguobacterium sp. KRL4]
MQTKEHMTLILYSRPGCTLCEEAAVLLDFVLDEFPGWTYQEINIDEDAALSLRFLYEIPVVMYQSEIWSYGKFETEPIRNRLLEKS